MKSRQGLIFDVPLSLRFIFKDIFLHRSYAPTQLLRKLPQSPVVLDLGANAGFFSLFAFHIRPQAKVLSFEPLPANYHLLRQNHSMQSGFDWQIFNEAISNQSGTAWLQCANRDDLSTTASLRQGTDSTSAEKIKVKTRTLTEVLNDTASGFCDWLKIDVEGSEYEIIYNLDGDTLRKIRTVAIEADPIDLQRKNRLALATFLANRNFDVLLADDAVIYGLNRSF